MQKAPEFSLISALPVGKCPLIGCVTFAYLLGKSSQSELLQEAGRALQPKVLSSHQEENGEEEPRV